jgi:hypothetical protein
MGPRNLGSVLRAVRRVAACWGAISGTFAEIALLQSAGFLPFRTQGFALGCSIAVFQTARRGLLLAFGLEPT